MTDIGHIKKLVEEELRSHETMLRITQLADRIAQQEHILAASRHETAKEHADLTRIVNQEHKAIETQEREAKYVEREIARMVADRHGERLAHIAEAVLRDMEEEEIILRDIEYILSKKGDEQIVEVRKLIAKLLQHIEKAYHELLQERAELNARP